MNDPAMRDRDTGSSCVSCTVEAAVATVCIDQGKVNALNGETRNALERCALMLDEDRAVSSIVLTGGPRVFAAGVDITELAGFDLAGMVEHSRVMQRQFTSIAQIGKPVVAAVNGYALGGGCELALCADVRIAGESARFGQPEVKLGIMPGAGGTQRLTRLVGPAKAKDLIFSGRMIDAEEALAIGLVDEVVPDGRTIERATEWARQFADGPALALRAAKQAIDVGGGLDQASGLELERMLFAGLFATRDREEGMRSFLEDGPGKARFSGS